VGSSEGSRWGRAGGGGQGKRGCTDYGAGIVGVEGFRDGVLKGSKKYARVNEEEQKSGARHGHRNGCWACPETRL
jgi:hypothetical protein